MMGRQNQKQEWTCSASSRQRCEPGTATGQSTTFDRYVLTVYLISADEGLSICRTSERRLPMEDGLDRGLSALTLLVLLALPSANATSRDAPPWRSHASWR